jgi:hypothetical protein
MFVTYLSSIFPQGETHRDATREILTIPEGMAPIIFTPPGYPASEPGAKKRKELGDLVRYEHWQGVTS